MPTWFACAYSGRSAAPRRTAKAVLIAGLSLLAVASGAAAFGLETLTISASRMVAKDAAPVLAGELRGIAAVTRPQLGGFAASGLVSQDRSTLDLTQLSMSAFGDADELSR